MYGSSLARPGVFLALCALAGCAASGPSEYGVDTVLPAPESAVDSLQRITTMRMQGLGFTVYDAQQAFQHLNDLGIQLSFTQTFQRMMFADQEHGCGLFCKQVDGLLVLFFEQNGRERLGVTAITYKRPALLADWKFVKPSATIRSAADSLFVTLGVPIPDQTHRKAP